MTKMESSHFVSLQNSYINIRSTSSFSIWSTWWRKGVAQCSFAHPADLAENKRQEDEEEADQEEGEEEKTLVREIRRINGRKRSSIICIEHEKVENPDGLESHE